MWTWNKKGRVNTEMVSIGNKKIRKAQGLKREWKMYDVGK